MNTITASLGHEFAVGAVANAVQGRGLAQPKALNPAIAAKQSDDADVLERIAAGDKLAMKVLYARHHVQTYQFMLRLVGDEAHALPDLADDPEMAVQKKDRVAIMRQCLSHLSLVHREIIDLAYYQDKPINEVAEILGVPENTVKTRMFHARRRLSELLAQAGIDRTYQ